MATITKFEDLVIWQLSFRLCKMINNFIFKEPFSKDFGLKNQIDNSSGSVMDNIAEGFERGSRNEFINFLGFSKGSAGEVKSQLYRALYRNYITQSEFDEAYNLADLTGRKINKLINYLNHSTFKGEKFKNRELKEPGENYSDNNTPYEILNYFESLKSKLQTSNFKHQTKNKHAQT